MSSIVYVYQRNNTWQNKWRMVVIEVSLSNLKGYARVKCGFNSCWVKYLFITNIKKFTFRVYLQVYVECPCKWKWDRPLNVWDAVKISQPLGWMLSFQPKGLSTRCWLPHLMASTKSQWMARCMVQKQNSSKVSWCIKTKTHFVNTARVLRMW